MIIPMEFIREFNTTKKPEIRIIIRGNMYKVYKKHSGTEVLGFGKVEPMNDFILMGELLEIINK